jgi:CRP-like cAMP-binding protein
MIRDEATAALEQAEFFDICDDEQRRMLAFASDLRRFDPDSVLYKAGDLPGGAFILVSGTLKAKPEGGAKPYAVSVPGSVISAMALILEKPRPLTVTAVTEAETLFVPRHAFIKLVQQSPDLAQRAVARVQADIGAYLGALDPLRKRMKPDA